MTKVLIVDDSQELLDLFLVILTWNGYIVQTASSGNVVLNKLSDYSPDIILLDVRLNGEDGRELCREIKQNNTTKHIPVILLSASPELLKDYELCEAVDIIEKPFDIKTISKKIEVALEMQKK